MQNYFHSLNHPEYGLAHYGITIIPPESLLLFFDIITPVDILKNLLNLMN